MVETLLGRSKSISEMDLGCSSRVSSVTCWGTARVTKRTSLKLKAIVVILEFAF
jgi:hypothetical protein